MRKLIPGYDIKWNLKKLSINQTKTRWLNFVPIFGGFKMIWEIIRWKQFISDNKTTYIWHTLAITWQLGTYAAGIAQAYIFYKEWWDVDMWFIVGYYDQVVWSS